MMWLKALLLPLMKLRLVMLTPFWEQQKRKYDAALSVSTS
jgi:hypothetical protein